MSFIEKLTGDLGGKKRWRAYKARAAALPEPYRTAVAGIERYLMHTGGIADDGGLQMWEDFADLFEQAAVDRKPIRDIVGDDPVVFADTFAANYGQGSWLVREQERLKAAIAKAEAVSE